MTFLPDDWDSMDDELYLPSVFIDESMLSIDILPATLLFRGDNFKSIGRNFRSIFSNQKKFNSILISGKVGTGKSSIARRYGIWAEGKGREKQIKIKYLHINCKRNNSAFMVANRLCLGLMPKFPSRGYSAPEMLVRAINKLEKDKISLMLVLDEVDSLNKEDLNMVLSILSTSTDSMRDPNHSISLFLIAKDMEFRESLDENISDRISPENMILKPYSMRQIREILEYRMEQSMYPGTMMDEALRVIVEHTGTDVRRGLKLIHESGKLADQNQRSIIHPEYVWEVIRRDGL